MLCVQDNSDGIVFKVYVQPMSSKNMIAGIYGDALKLKLTAPPLEGAANKMCIGFLAKWLKVSKSSIEIVSGQTSRLKKVLVRYQRRKGSDREMERLKCLIGSAGMSS